VDSATGEVKGGTAELPGRPAAQLLQSQAPQNGVSRGVYYPSGAFSKFLQQGKDSDFAQNFSAADLAWNRGGSQQDEKEFKEGYLDMEFFDSRLWVRAGRQNIVWGKTELFHAPTSSTRSTSRWRRCRASSRALHWVRARRLVLLRHRSARRRASRGRGESRRHRAPTSVSVAAVHALVACNKRTALWALV
jgi:hypothetical protein